MKKMMAGLAGALSLLTAHSAAAAAAEPVQTYELDEIVVVGHLEDTEEAKSSVNVKELIDAGQIKTAADILANVPGVVVTKGSNNGVQVGLRGLNHERTVIAINGNVVQNIGEIAMGRAMEWDALPVTGIKKIELIRGTTARYGGAVGGVINIITDDADVPGAKTTVRQSFGSWNTRKTTLIHQGTTADQRISYNVNASYAKSGGYYRNNDSNGHNLHFDVTYKLNKDDKLNLSYSHIYNREGIILANNRTRNPAAAYLGYDSAYPTTPNAQNWGDGRRQWKTDNIALQYTTPNTTLSVFDYRQTRHDDVRRVIKPMGKLRLLDWATYWDAKLRNYGLNWQQTSYAGLHELHYGIQYGKMIYEIRNEGSKYELPSTGIFVEDDWTLSEHTSLGLSLRYDYNQFEANSGALRDKTHTQLSPGVKITQRLNKGQSLYLGARRLFRSPTVADYSRWSTGYTDSGNAYRNAFAPGLSHAEWQAFLGVPEPEKGMSYELGWRAKFGENTAVGVTGFYYDIDDFLNIQFKGGLLPPIVYNVGNVKVKGVELTGEHRLSPHWAVSAGYTRQNTSKSGDRFNAPLKGMPESTFNAGVRWDSLHGLQSALDLRYIGSVPGSSDSDYISPYTVADLTVSYAFKSHIINLAVNNLFDRYYEQTRDFRQPGINYNLSYQYTF